MSFNPSSPLSGATVTGATAPTFGITADTQPAINAKQWAVTAIGGTLSGATVHSASCPFTMSWFRPLVLRLLGRPNAATGLIKDIPHNMWKLKVRKGLYVAAGQVPEMGGVDISIDVPAGSETYDSGNVAAMLLVAADALYAQADGIYQSVKTGIA